MEKARDTARELRMTDAAFDGSVNIYLKEGEYYINDTVTFSKIDSGSFTKPLNIVGLGKAVLKQSVSLDASQFKPLPDSEASKIINVSAANKIKYINLYDCGINDLGTISKRGHSISENKKPQGELYINGKRGTIARYPNSGWLVPNSVFSADSTGNITPIASSDYDTAGNGFYLDNPDNRFQKWSNPQLAWASGSLRANFAYDYIPVKSIDCENNAVTVSGTVKNYYSKSFFYFENIFEELDAENEYYIDYTTGNLYVYLPDNAEELEFSVSENPILTFTDISYVNIKNIEFEYGRGSAVTASSTSNIVLDGCSVHGFGESGITLGSTSFSAVKNSHIYDIGETGLSVGGGDYNNLYGNGNLIYNNEIHDFAQLERSYNAGIHLSYRSVGTTVKNNYLYNSPHAALIFYGVNHLIEKNEFENCVTDFHDMDAVYCNLSEFPWERGTVIKNNYFHNIGNKMLAERQMNISAVRTDNYGHGLTITGNLFYNIGMGRTNAVSAVRAQGTYNRISYNMIVNSSEAYSSYPSYNENAAYPNNSTIKSNLSSRLPVYSRFFPELTNYWSEHYANTKTNEFKYNAVINIDFPMSKINGAQNAEGFRGDEKLVDACGNFVVDKDGTEDKYKEIFKDYENGNMSIINASLIDIADFPAINTDTIGLIK